MSEVNEIADHRSIRESTWILPHFGRVFRGAHACYQPTWWQRSKLCSIRYINRGTWIHNKAQLTLLSFPIYINRASQGQHSAKYSGCSTREKDWARKHHPNSQFVDERKYDIESQWQNTLNFVKGVVSDSVLLGSQQDDTQRVRAKREKRWSSIYQQPRITIAEEQFDEAS